MKFVATPLAGAWVVEAEPVEDARGFFARTWCRETFRSRGLCAELAQCSTSYNRLRGTLRGMHFQAAPHEETKLVRCTRGAMFDVVVDLRRDSPTFGRWFATELTAENLRMLYVPAGFAHGFLTLAEATETFYQISVPYRAEAGRGFRWDDPAVGIEWPARPAVISERDRSLPAFSEALSP